MQFSDMDLLGYESSDDEKCPIPSNSSNVSHARKVFLNLKSSSKIDSGPNVISPESLPSRRPRSLAGLRADMIRKRRREGDTSGRWEFGGIWEHGELEEINKLGSEVRGAMLARDG